MQSKILNRMKWFIYVGKTSTQFVSFDSDTIKFVHAVSCELAVVDVQREQFLTFSSKIYCFWVASWIPSIHKRNRSYAYNVFCQEIVNKKMVVRKESISFTSSTHYYTYILYIPLYVTHEVLYESEANFPLTRTHSLYWDVRVHCRGVRINVTSRFAW